MRLLTTTVEPSPIRTGWVRLAAEVEYERGRTERERIWFAVPSELEQYLSRTGNPWLACLAPIAAHLGEDIAMELPVDAQLRRGVQEVFSVWKSWYPELTIPKLDVGDLAGPIEPSTDARTASYFSGGIDSFFTLVHHDANLSKEESSIDDLLSVWGFDVPLTNAEAFERMHRSLEKAAHHLEKRLVPIATNLRVTEFARPHWAYLSHGCALAAVALALEPRYRTVLISSTFPARSAKPWGSHFLTDPQFSTSRMEVVHYGSEFTRVEKTALVAQVPAAQTALRVCWRRRSDGNCGQCEKCYRTMVTLYLLGELDEFIVFDSIAWEPADVRNTYLGSDMAVQAFEEILALAEDKGQVAIAESIREALGRSRRITRVRNYLKPLGNYPLVSEAANRIERRLLRKLVV